MPREYTKIRDSIHSRCEEGKHPGKKSDESCLKYAKRLASIIYYKRTGKTPQESDAEIKLIEAVEQMLGLVNHEED